MSRLGFSRAGSDRRVIELGPLDTALVALMKAGAPIRHDCGGKALCGTCRVRVSAPAAGPAPRGLSPMAERERARLEALGERLDGSVRLACQLRSVRDLEVEAILPMNGERTDV